MEFRTVRTEKNGLTVVARETLGKDRITKTYIQGAIVNALFPRYGLTKATDLTNAVWATVIDVVDIIVQAVSLEETGDAHWPETLVLPDPSNHPACIAFYDTLMESSDRYISLLLKAVEAVNADVPNLTGATTAPQSQREPNPDSLVTAEA